MASGLGQAELLNMHERITQLVLHNDRLITERTNIFLLASSILFAAFTLLFDHSVGSITVALPCVGIAFCILHFFNIRTTFLAFRFYWSRAIAIEELDEFKALRCAELTPFSAAFSYFRGDAKWEQMSLKHRYLRLAQLWGCKGRVRRFFLFQIVDPLKIQRFYIPAGFIILWAFGLTWVL